jgi:sn-glycerol 3-phosphate transport system substrate-binding protein
MDFHTSTGYVPITLAAYEMTRKSGFYEKNPGAEITIRELTNKTPTANSKGLRFGNFVQGREVIEEEMEAVFAGRKEAKAALDDAVKRGNEILRKFEATARN